MKGFRLPDLSIELSALVQGTLGFARRDQADVERVLDAAFELGCTAFDTASVYGRGEAEGRLGQWIARRRCRNGVVIIDKGCHPRGSVRRVSPECLEEDIEGSLGHLGVSEIDVFLLHRDDPDLDVSVIMDALHEQRCRGRIRAFGVSNWTHHRLEAACAHAELRGYTGPVVSSPGFSLATAKASWPGCVTLSAPQDAEPLRWYRERNFPVLAWSPLASGYLAGSVPARPQTDEDWQIGAARDFYASEENAGRLLRLERLSREMGLTTAQLAIAYVFNKGLEGGAVVGCRTPSEFESCAAATEIKLTRDDLQFLEQGPSGG